jgi:hypothetical protein
MKQTAHCLLLALLGTATAVWAVDPKLNSTSPVGLQRGTEAVLTFDGQRLDDTQEVLLYAPGVEVLKIEEKTATTVKVRVKIAADCPLGEQRVRLRTAGGLSDLRTFHVGAFPVVEKVAPAKRGDPLQKLPLNVTVTGSVAQETVDAYTVDLKKGQHLSAEVTGMRLGRSFTDPYISIKDPNGKVLAKSDDTPLFVQDCFATIVAPLDGEYTIEVRESSYGGLSLYQLHVGNFPRPTAVYPAGGKAGETLQVKFIGDAAGPFSQKVTLPLPSSYRQGVFAEKNGLIAPSANPVRVVDFANVLETEPNDESAAPTATSLDLPLAFNGIIEKAGDVDWFRFKAKRGEVYDVNVYARRVRSPLDSLLIIANAEGRTIISNDDSDGADSYVRFNVPADGEYLLKVADHLGRGGPDFTYRVEFAPVKPDLNLYVQDTARYDTQTRKSIVVARGNRFATLMSVRRSNFSGDLVMGNADFPAGITMHSDLVAASQTAIPIVFEARADAPVSGRLGSVTARLVNSKDGREISGCVWQNYDLVQNGNDGVYYVTYSDKIAVAVVEELPFTVDVVEPKAPIPQNGALNLKIRATRKPGFEVPINVKMLFNPTGIGSPPEVVIPGDQSSVEYPLNANGGAQTRDWKIAVLGSATVSNGTAYASSQLATLGIAEAFVQGRIEMTSVLRGNAGKVVCKLDQKIPFDGQAEIRLNGLPSGVEAAPKFITKDTTEVIFDVTTATNATRGLHRTLFCSAIIKKNNEMLTQTLGAGGLFRIDTPRPAMDEAPAKAAVPAKKGAGNQ